jgi:hypothetical protein
VVKLWWIRGELWCPNDHFLGREIYAGVLKFIFGWLWKNNCNGKSNGNDFVASSVGLRSCLRQSGSAFRRGFFVGLKPHANPVEQRH